MGVKNRLYAQHIKHGRKLGLAENMNIDLDDVESYPKAVFELYQEKQKYDVHIKRKEKKIEKTEKDFHSFAAKRIIGVAEARAKRGLNAGTNTNYSEKL